MPSTQWAPQIRSFILVIHQELLGTETLYQGLFGQIFLMAVYMERPAEKS